MRRLVPATLIAVSIVTLTGWSENLAKKTQWAVFEVSDLARQRKELGRPYLEFLRVDSLNAGLYRLPAGADDMQKPHDEDEIYYVLAGRAAIDVAGEKSSVGPGSVIYVKADVEHHFEAIEQDIEVLVVFASAGTRKKN